MLANGRKGAIVAAILNYAIWGVGYYYLGLYRKTATLLIVLFAISFFVFPSFYGPDLSFLLRNLMGLLLGYDGYRLGRRLAQARVKTRSSQGRG